MHSTPILLDLRCLNIHLAHALLYMHRPRGLKNVPARGRGARLSASPPDDENEVIQTVCGRPKYTLAFSYGLSPIYTSASNLRRSLRRDAQACAVPDVHLSKNLTACQFYADRKRCDWSARTPSLRMYLSFVCV